MHVHRRQLSDQNSASTSLELPPSCIFIREQKEKEKKKKKKRKEKKEMEEMEEEEEKEEEV